MSKIVENIDFDFKKINNINFNRVSKFNLLKKGIGWFSKITSGIAITSLFFLLNHVPYEQQIKFIENDVFSASFLLFFSLYMVFSIIKEVFNDFSKKINVFTPFYFVIMISTLTPYESGHSLFSDYIVFIINLLKPIFHINYS